MNRFIERAKQLDDDSAYKYIKHVLDEVSFELNKKINNGDMVSTSDFDRLFESAMGIKED